MNISPGGVIEIQTRTASSCGSEIYCTCSLVIYEETQKIMIIPQFYFNFIHDLFVLASYSLVLQLFKLLVIIILIILF